MFHMADEMGLVDGVKARREIGSFFYSCFLGYNLVCLALISYLCWSLCEVLVT